MGPELFGKKAEAVKATDIWALGASLYELLSGELPFMGQGGVMQLHGAETPDIPEQYGKDLQTILEGCLEKETWERPTADQLRDYAEAKLQGRNPVKTWGEQGIRKPVTSTMEAQGGQGADREADKTISKRVEEKPTVPLAATSKVEIEKEVSRKGKKKNRVWVFILLAIIVVSGVVWGIMRENKRQEIEQAERIRIAMAEKARQDSITYAQAEKRRQAEEARKRQEAEAARQRAEQERQREAEARRRATSNRTIRVGNVSFEMVYVQGGTFQMGATAEQGEDAWDDENPVHSVSLSDFHIGKHEVTQGLWEEVMGGNPSYNKAGDNYPVESVSWEDCQRFIERLNNRTGLHFRLPTEAEWEYAARGGRKSRGYKYSGSTYDLGSVAWYDGNSGNRTHPVGQKQANELGLYDMSGNVYEWCQDWKGTYSNSSQWNPTGPVSGSLRVLRGGSRWLNAGYCRVSYRSGHGPGGRFVGSGLRLALSL